MSAAPEEPRFLREIMEEILDEAARAGFPDPEKLWHMSPAAIERAIAAHAAQSAREDRMAWMAGYYCAIAFHAPRRFPRKPHLIHQPSRSMTESQMRQALLALAAERSSYDVGDPQNTVSGGNRQP